MRRQLSPLLFLLFACTARHAAVDDAPIHVVLVSTTDVHGRFETQEEPTAVTSIPRVRRGGADVLGGYLANLRAAAGNRVVLLDAGDMFQGTLASNITEGAIMVDVYNALGYNSVAIGNHELDFGPVGPQSSPKDGQDPLGALKSNIDRARYQFLSANIFEKSTGKRPAWARPHALLDIGGLKIGVIGLTTQETPGVTFPKIVESLSFVDPVPVTREAAAELRRQGAAVVVVVTHMGGACKDISNPRDSSSCSEDEELFRLARALPVGTIDALFGGHTHNQVRHFVNGIPTAQAGQWGRAFATMDLWIDPRKNRVIPSRTEIRPPTMICEHVFEGTESCDPKAAPAGKVTLERRVFLGRPIVPDARIAQVYAPLLRQVAIKRAEPVGIVLAAPFTRDSHGETALGNLAADALRDAAGADFGVFNPGGIRADLHGPEVKYGEIFEVFPFDNVLATLRLRGREVHELLQAGLDGGRALQVSGLRVVIDESFPERTVVDVRRTDGSPLSSDAIYTIATNDFLAAGGDNLARVTSRLAPGDVRLYYDKPVRDVVIAILRKWAASGPLVPKTEGRILFVRSRGVIPPPNGR